MSTDTKTPERQLNALDRCDRCGAQAYVMVPFPKVGNRLLFCSSHWTRIGDAVKASPAADVEDIIDDRAFLLVDANLVRNTEH